MCYRLTGLPELKSEFNVNYLSIVTMIDAFLPHFRKLVVSQNSQPP